MTKATKITMFKCGACSGTFETRKEADKHCLCKCGAPVTPRKWGFVNEQCQRCRVKSAIRDAQNSVRRTKTSLADYEDHLATLQKEKAKIDAARKKP